MNNKNRTEISNFIINIIYSIILIFCLSILYEGLKNSPMTYKENMSLAVFTTFIVNLIRDDN